MRACAIAWTALLCVGCKVGESPANDAAPDDDAGVQDEEDCPAPLKQHILPEYQVDIAPAEWAALEDEFLNRLEREAAGLPVHPYHPVTLRYQGTEVPGAMLRLKGNSSWLQTIELDDRPKMQFVISFNETDPDGRFHGMRKVELDMPRSDPTFLRQRLALFALRSMGIPAQCANSARLVINGEYYGLYTHLERLDIELLQRLFPGQSDGDLWEHGVTIETNEDTFSWVRLDALWAAHDVGTLAALADLEASVREWAAEAVVPHGDGYYWARPNFFLYDHPGRGFLWLPHDLDSSLDFRPADASPLTPVVEANADPLIRQHWRLVMEDPTWSARYLTALEEMRAAYPVDELEARVDAWSRQIAAAADADPRKPFTDTQHRAAIAVLRGHMARRAAFLDDWLACRRAGDLDDCP